MAAAGAATGLGALATEAAAASPSYDVRANGATGDGSTDDTRALQATIDAAKRAGGGTVVVPAGTYVTRTLTLPGRVLLAGAGIESTVLRRKAGTDGAVLETEGFAGLTRSNRNDGVNAFGVADLTVDGNRQDGAAGSGVRIYGVNFVLRDLRVRNCAEHGIFSEWGDGGVGGDGGDQMEAFVSRVKSHDNGGDGIRWQGPHDSSWDNVITYRNGGCGVEVSGNGLGLQATNTHSWGTSQRNAFRLAATGVVLVSCQAEGSREAQVLILADGCQLRAAHVYNGFTVTNLGVQFGDADHAVGVCVVDAYLNAVDDGALVFANDKGDNFVQAQIYSPGGRAIAGNPHPSTKLEVYASGDPGASRDVIPEHGAITLGGHGGPTVSTGFGSPEGSVVAAQGSLHTRRDGDAGTTLYVKTAGHGPTGWRAVA